MPFLERPDGCRLYYELHGRWDTALRVSPLLLLEGMGGDIPGWRRNIPTLSAARPLIAYDFRGNGLSDPPRGRVTMATFVDDTVALLDSVEVRAVHAYGQSFGAMVAQELALTHPQRVRSLVLAATHAGPKGATPSRARAKVPKDRPYLALYSEAFARDHPEHVEEDQRVGRRNPQPLSAGRRQWEAMQAWDAWGRLPAISCPVLILHGTEDRMVDVANAERMAALIPDAQLALLDGAGHVYHSEQPEAADAAVLAFLGRVEGRG